MSIKDRLKRRARGLLNRVSSEQVKQTRRKLARKEQENAALRAMLAKQEVGAQVGGVRPENVVWVFGAGRTGSSWLAFMMGSLPDHSRWNEPLVGALFGNPYNGEKDDDDARAGIQRERTHFVLGEDFEDIWLRSLRGLVLDGATARFPKRAEEGYVVIKEPHGSAGAPLLMRALPESRMIFLVRDPRDRAASILDAHRKGSRPSSRRVAKRPELFEKPTRADKKPDDYVRQQAQNYSREMGFVERAYEAHEGPKTLVRYEDLRADTLGEMKRIYSDLGIPVREADLVRAIEKHSWEKVPEDEKGPGKIRRKASPGGWREDLTPEQATIVEGETAHILDRFYAGG